MSIVNKPQAESGAVVPVSQGNRSRPSGPVLASSPRASLLPPEITDNNRRRAVRGWLRVIVVVVVVIALVGVGGAWYFQFSAQQDLAASQKETASLAAQKAGFKNVSATLAAISGGTAAEKVGGGTDIEWSTYLQKLQATLPAGVQLTDVTITSADAQQVFGQSTVPLEGERIATLSFSATSPTLPSIPTWIDGLSTLPGFADASPDNVSQGDTGYTAAVTMHINTGAYSYRFDPAGKKGHNK